MNKNEALNILKEMQNEIKQMTDEELFSHLVDSSETFRRENMEGVLHEEYEEMKNEKI